MPSREHTRGKPRSIILGKLSVPAAAWSGVSAAFYAILSSARHSCCKWRVPTIILLSVCYLAQYPHPSAFRPCFLFWFHVCRNKNTNNGGSRIKREMCMGVGGNIRNLCCVWGLLLDCYIFWFRLVVVFGLCAFLCVWFAFFICLFVRLSLSL